GVPDELKYLAMIESGLNPRARSWARAVGMWQVISATGKAYGLTVNGWVDERMDPEKATRAAARHLRDLHEMFGDWHLALAGYNYSPGKLRRKVRAAEQRLGRKATYWDVYNEIPRETRNYVPMFIAASLVASQPVAFGMEAPNPGPEYSYHVVPVYGVHSLETIAGLANSDTRTVKALNPELVRGMLPPSIHPYPVKIPVGTYDTFVAAYQALPEELRKPAEEHRVNSGETLSGIASKFGTSTRALMRLNNLTKTRIYPGQRLAVPMLDKSYTADKAAAAGPNPVQYPQRLNRPVAVTGVESEKPNEVFARVRQESTNSIKSTAPAKTVSTKPEPKPEANRIVYTVKSGDTLGEIAEQFRVRASNIRSWNNIRGSKIVVGQKLTIYSNSGPARTTYRVKRGDTLSTIASRYGVSVADIKKWNGLKNSRIQAGQRLVINT
ncbi:MAG: LysM peptidoglycan-binding domain-containing protein, partial [Rhodothermales bacterium]|nr:LysM peptidoglycan-binding domain-containing protein [Rhodothermales bacterium]